jgi:uncharacterized protein involved in exopolysaccharide biosynthesis
MTIATAPAVDEVPPPAARPKPRWPRRVAWVLVLALAGGLLGVAVASRLNPRYAAEVDILVTPMIGNAYSSTGGNHLVDLETESHLPSSDAVLRRVAADGESAPSEQVIRRRLSVHVVPNAQVIVIDYAAETPAQSRAMALRIADATLKERSAIAAAAAASREEITTAKLAALSKEQTASGASPARLALLSQRAVALNGELREAATGALASPGQVIDTVNRGDSHLAKIRLVVVAGFVLGGGLLGLWVGRAPRRPND